MEAKFSANHNHCFWSHQGSVRIGLIHADMQIDHIDSGVLGDSLLRSRS